MVVAAVMMMVAWYFAVAPWCWTAILHMPASWRVRGVALNQLEFVWLPPGYYCSHPEIPGSSLYLRYSRWSTDAYYDLFVSENLAPIDE